VPRAADVEAGRTFVQELARQPGAVLVTSHGYLPYLAGRDPHASAVAIADVLRGTFNEPERDLAAELEEAVRTRRFAAIVTLEDRTRVEQLLPLEQYYRLSDRIVDRRSRFWRPEVRHVPR
jgi:hypothetical protein